MFNRFKIASVAVAKARPLSLSASLAVIEYTRELSRPGPVLCRTRPVSPGTQLRIPVLQPGDLDVLVGTRHVLRARGIRRHVGRLQRSLLFKHFRL
jgi:hypothetical protein